MRRERLKEKERAQRENKQQDPFLRGEVKAEAKERMTGRMETKATQRGREVVLAEDIPQLGWAHKHTHKTRVK